MQKYKYLKEITNLINSLILTEAKKTTLFLEKNLIIRAVRKTYGNKIIKGQNIEVILTIGRPNAKEKEYIKEKKPSPRTILVKFFKQKK